MMGRRILVRCSRWIGRASGVAVAMAMAGGVNAQTPEPSQAEPRPEQSQPALIVRDLCVLTVSRGGEIANDPRDFGSTLFNGAYRRRPLAGDTNRPMPVGIITLQGQIDEPRMVEVRLPSDEDARVLGYWPKTQARRDAVAWYSVDEAKASANLMPIDVKHWLAPLRSAEDRIRFETRGNREKFFLYDASLGLTSPIDLGFDPSGNVVVSLRESRSADAVLILNNEAEQLSTAYLQLAAPGRASPAAALAPVQKGADPFLPIIKLMQGLGFNHAEQRVTLDILKHLSLISQGMTGVVVYRNSQMDKLLPLSVKPAADQTHRLGLLVLTHIDPNIDRLIDRTIEQLGSEVWATREQATRNLIDLGRAAIEQVQTHRNHPDPEIAHRIDLIIDAYAMRYGGLAE